MAEIELELTFLAKAIPSEIASVAPVRLVDIYIPDGVEHPELRLRQKGNAYEITKKVPLDGIDFSQHNEFTIPLSQREYQALAATSQRIVEKDRYQVQIGGYPAEVDVFAGALTGLVLIDFEFSSYESKANFLPPSDICLNDVTQLEWLAGGVLAGKSYDDIAANLTQIGYTKIES